MQNYPVALHHHYEEREISQRTQNLLGSLNDLWKRLQGLSHEQAKSILDMAARFPEPYATLILQSVADKLVSSMVVHYLDILARFREKAAQEGIDAEEQAATFAESLGDLLPMLTGLSRRLAVETLDDLVTLAAITVGLYGLSHAESAEQAQHWLYVLPQEYSRQLAQEHLIAPSSPQFTVTVHVSAVPSLMGLSPVKLSFAAPTSQLHFVVSSAPEETQRLDSPISDSPTAIAA